MLCLLARQSDSARAASSTDGNNYNFSSSGRPRVTPFTALRQANRDLSVQSQLASGSRPAAVLRHCQSCGPLQNCLRATVTLSLTPSRRPGDPGEDFRVRVRAQGIQVTRKAHAGDVMAGAGGAAGPAPDVRHQPAGDVYPQVRINLSNTIQKSSMYQRWWCSSRTAVQYA